MSNAQYLDLDIPKALQWLWKDETSRYILLYGGRGGSKSFSLNTFLVDLMVREAYQRILFTRYTMVSAEKSIVPEFEAKINDMGFGASFKATGKQIDATWDSTNHILFSGIKTSSGNQTASLKSVYDYNTVAFEEAEEIPDLNTFRTIVRSIRTQKGRNRIILAFNPSHVRHWIYQQFFKGRMADGKDVPNGFNGVIGNVRYIYTSYLDIPDKLDQGFLDDATDAKERDLLSYQNEFLGYWQSDVDGALWNNIMIDAAHNLQVRNEELTEIVISVDPSAGDATKAELDAGTKTQDECGIMICGKTADDRYVVLEDRSGIMKPGRWAKEVLRAYREWDANAIIAERNNGGAMVEDVIRNAIPQGDERNAIPIHLIHASKGKRARAEPAATLYSRQRVSHRKGLGQLEVEQCTFTGRKGEQSPNRYDAMVWGLLYLSKSISCAPRVHDIYDDDY